VEEVVKVLETFDATKILIEMLPQIKVISSFILGLYLGYKLGCWRMLRKCQKGLNKWWKERRN